MRDVLAMERSIQAIEPARRHGCSEEPIVAVADLALAVTRIWQGRLEGAEPRFERAQSALRAEVEPAAGLMLHVARGLLELGRGRDEQALAAFRAAERLADLLVKAFSPQPQGLLPQTIVRQGEMEHVEAALAELGEQDHETGTKLSRRPQAGRLREPLTQSEIRVLRYLPTNLSQPEIAEELALSVNTINTHIRHLYRKLGVHRRGEAVERARDLGLLAPSARRR
jgi:ATP/maltotriose-dependent transcriptional regulator MalT